RVDVEDVGEVTVDIDNGGNFYGIVKASDVHVELTTNNASAIIDQAIAIRNQINETEEVVHPEFPFIQRLTHIEFFSNHDHPDADVKNTVVVPPGGIDRSPCGTGTSAKVALMHERKELAVDELFVHESIVGSLFKARVLEPTKVKDLEAVIPEVTGSAWIMGMHRFFYNERDPLNEGFLLIPPMDE